MFYWQLAITAQQIALLRAFDAWGEGYVDIDKPWPGSVSNGHFIQAVGALTRHRLVVHESHPQRNGNAKQWWGITVKGRAILRAIAEDAKQLKSDVSTVTALPASRKKIRKPEGGPSGG